MKKSNSNSGPMDAALKFLTPKARTVRETELYLDKCQFGEFEVYSVIERLKELGYLDDKAYADEFIRSRLATKPVSRRKLREQLTAHQLDNDIINEALASVSEGTELENAMLTAKKLAVNMTGYNHDDKFERIAKRLVSRGFDYSVVMQCVSSLCENGLLDMSWD